VSANQRPDYRPAPVTQRDGSKLQNSNCRMASIATGLDFDTLGAKKSTGARMRAHQSDQEGGTDSGDAKRAWASGYDENLDIQDGKLWSDVLTDLRRFRVVHLDVWHATVGGPCLSGTGRYGHTIVVAPDCVDNNWLVCDPWCSPAKWSRVSESKLKAGAEEWGRRVYGAATSGPGASEHPSLDVLRYIAKRLMSRYHPGDDGEEDPSPDPRETGGAQQVMYTATTPHPPKTPVPPTTGGTTMGIYYNLARWKATKTIPVYLDTTGATKVRDISAGTEFTSIGVRAVVDSDGKDSTWRAVKVNTTGLDTDSSESVEAILWTRAADYPPDSLPTSSDWDKSAWALLGDPDGRYPAPTTPPPPTQDCGPVVSEAVEKRDTEWREWALEGSPGQRERSTMADSQEV
jgi:hypothetical protein